MPPVDRFSGSTPRAYVTDILNLRLQSSEAAPYDATFPHTPRPAMIAIAYWTASGLLLLLLWVLGRRRRRQVRRAGYWVRDADEAGFYVLLAILALASLAIWRLGRLPDPPDEPPPAAGAPAARVGLEP